MLSIHLQAARSKKEDQEETLEEVNPAKNVCILNYFSLVYIICQLLSLKNCFPFGQVKKERDQLQIQLDQMKFRLDEVSC